MTGPTGGIEIEGFEYSFPASLTKPMPAPWALRRPHEMFKPCAIGITGLKGHALVALNDFYLVAIAGEVPRGDEAGAKYGDVHVGFSQTLMIKYDTPLMKPLRSRRVSKRR